MKKITVFAMLACCLAAGGLSAQFIVKPTFFETLAVSNQGLVSGYEAQGESYSIWNPDANEFYEIGGAAPGFGVGGAATFSNDGAFIGGTNYVELAINTDWQRNVLSDFNYIFKAIEFPESQQFWGFAVGQSLTSNGNGIVLRTFDGGNHWAPKWIDTNNRGLETMSFPTQYVGYVGGWNQYFAKTTSGGEDWIEMNPAGTDDVYIYRTITFKDEMNGIVTAQLQENAAVYVTADGGETWTSGIGLSGIPERSCYAGENTYFLVTSGGDIQKSIDNGSTWSTVFTNPEGILLGITFKDELTGIATTSGGIFKTVDGGTNWTQQTIAEGTNFRDVKWIDNMNIILAGSPDQIYMSDDAGATWTWSNEDLFNGEPALYGIAVTSTDIHVCGSQGNFYKKSRISSTIAAEMSRYNVSESEWTALGSLGQNVDNTTSAGFYISGDGNTVVGNSWADPSNGNGTTAYAHAFAWNQAEGTIDLGSMFSNINKSSRANAVSYDGSVVVGLQDFNGPWKSAVWLKNPAGGYFPNEYLLINPNGSATDEMNQLGECSYVTADGKWIGGEGDFANNNQPWIWSAETGVINLGTIAPEDNVGRVAGISPDGSMVVGWFNGFGWGATPTPFIWTATGGMQNINQYVAETLEIDTGDYQIWIANKMSENGKYLSGWGVNPNIGEFGELFTFRLELPELAVGEFETESATVYPNPVRSNLTIASEESITMVEVFNVSGQLLMTETRNGITSIDMSSLSNGVYFVKTHSGSISQTHKIIKQ